jgi:AcrR family transcriptional regulator
MSPRVSEKYRNEKIQSILDGAKKVFIRKGFFDATMQDIVEECNISRGGLYRYFDSTQEIFQDILEADLQEDANTANQFEEMNLSAIEILKTFVEGERESILNIKDTIIPAVYEFFIKNKRQGIASDLLIKRHDTALDIFSKVIEEGKLKGEFSNDLNPVIVSNYILTFIEGLIITSVSVGIDESILNEQIYIFLNFLEMYLKQKSTS